MELDLPFSTKAGCNHLSSGATKGRHALWGDGEISHPKRQGWRM